jgi:hypothetical protein
MDWHFGHNCRRYIPGLEKCRTLIENYGARAELLSERWVETPELLLYVGESSQAVLARISAGEIATKRQKSGRLLFKVRGAWAYDDCFLKASGGKCLYYEPHGGPRIICIEDIKRFSPIHPNTGLASLQAQIAMFEREVVNAVNVADADFE